MFWMLSSQISLALLNKAALPLVPKLLLIFSRTAKRKRSEGGFAGTSPPDRLLDPFCTANRILRCQSRLKAKDRLELGLRPGKPLIRRFQQLEDQIGVVDAFAFPGVNPADIGVGFLVELLDRRHILAALLGGLQLGLYGVEPAPERLDLRLDLGLNVLDAFRGHVAMALAAGVDRDLLAMLGELQLGGADLEEVVAVGHMAIHAPGGLGAGRGRDAKADVALEDLLLPMMRIFSSRDLASGGMALHAGLLRILAQLGFIGLLVRVVADHAGDPGTVILQSARLEILDGRLGILGGKDVRGRMATHATVVVVVVGRQHVGKMGGMAHLLKLGALAVTLVAGGVGEILFDLGLVAAARHMVGSRPVAALAGDVQLGKFGGLCVKAGGVTLGTSAVPLGGQLQFHPFAGLPVPVGGQVAVVLRDIVLFAGVAYGVLYVFLLEPFVGPEIPVEQPAVRFDHMLAVPGALPVGICIAMATPAGLRPDILRRHGGESEDGDQQQG